jgi:hypothetical protein
MDRIYRICWIFLFPVSGRNRKYPIRFAELVPAQASPVIIAIGDRPIHAILKCLLTLFRRQAVDTFTVSSGNREKILLILLILSRRN